MTNAKTAQIEHQCTMLVVQLQCVQRYT